MTKLLHLKHWQLFLILVGFPVMLQMIVVSATIINRDPSAMMIAFPLMMLLFLAPFFCWFYALGTGLHKKLPSSVSMSITRFKVLLAIPIIYILFLCFLMFYVFSGKIAVDEESFSKAAYIVPVHLFAMFCIFYCLYFISKALKSVEWQRPVSFGEFAGEFFLIWFFPIGIWMVHPRINKIFSEEKTAGADLFGQIS